jgi:hypothetical protein
MSVLEPFTGELMSGQLPELTRFELKERIIALIANSSRAEVYSVQVVLPRLLPSDVSHLQTCRPSAELKAGYVHWEILYGDSGTCERVLEALLSQAKQVEVSFKGVRETFNLTRRKAAIVS